MTNLEEAIRERAYHLWTADGQPDGNADLYWLNAQRELLTTSLDASSSTADAAPAAAKPSKKAKPSRSEKKKAKAA